MHELQCIRQCSLKCPGALQTQAGSASAALWCVIGEVADVMGCVCVFRCWLLPCYLHAFQLIVNVAPDKHQTVTKNNMLAGIRVPCLCVDVRHMNSPGLQVTHSPSGLLAAASRRLGPLCALLRSCPLQPNIYLPWTCRLHRTSGAGPACLPPMRRWHCCCVLCALKWVGTATVAAAQKGI